MSFSLPYFPVIAASHRAAQAPVRYVVHAVLAVAAMTARRRAARIKVHLHWHDKVFHRRYHDAHFGAPDQRIASQVPVHNRLECGYVLAHEKKAEIVFSRHDKTV